MLLPPVLDHVSAAENQIRRIVAQDRVQLVICIKPAAGEMQIGQMKDSKSDELVREILDRQMHARAFEAGGGEQVQPASRAENFGSRFDLSIKRIHSVLRS